MEIKERFVIRRNDGVYVNLRYEPVKDISRAGRFTEVEDYETFINGYYKPPDASIYKPQKIRILYEEVNEDGNHEEAPGTV